VPVASSGSNEMPFGAGQPPDALDPPSRVF
jgi:hypothetical protein